jgi:RecJ-like exonuclease
MVTSCPFCIQGKMQVDGAFYVCPDCAGTGHIHSCELCDAIIPSKEELCFECDMKERGLE